MARTGFQLNYAGGKEVLNQLAAPHINAIAESIGAQAGDDAQVEPYTTDRAAASVTVPAHQQAKDGVLTRAASASGLEVRPK